MKYAAIVLGFVLSYSVSSHACPGGPAGAKCRSDLVAKCPGGPLGAKCRESVENRPNYVIPESMVCLSALSEANKGGYWEIGDDNMVSVVPGSGHLSLHTGQNQYYFDMDGRRLTVDGINCTDTTSGEHIEYRKTIKAIAEQTIKNIPIPKCLDSNPNSKCGSTRSAATAKVNDLKEACEFVLNKRVPERRRPGKGPYEKARQ